MKCLLKKDILNRLIVSNWDNAKYTLSDVFDFICGLTEYTKHISYIKLFGSYAKGTETSQSDIDIFICCKDRSEQEMLEISGYYWDALTAKFATNFDIIVNNEDDIDNRSLYRNIQKDGILIWNSKD